MNGSSIATNNVSSPDGWIPIDQRRGPVATAIVSKPGEPSSRLPVAALVDTGAFHTMISPECCARIGVTPSGRGHVTGLTSSKDCGIGTIEVALMAGARVVQIEVPVFIHDTPGFDLVVGCDLLKFFRFEMDGPGARFRLIRDREAQ